MERLRVTNAQPSINLWKTCGKPVENSGVNYDTVLRGGHRGREEIPGLGAIYTPKCKELCQ
jgi:hypothetical protein